jgi:hypothetical protein
MAGGPGARGGWSYTLQTVNLMEDPREQFSLTEGLARGVGGAHRQQVHGGPEFRNYRRRTPLDYGNTHPTEQLAAGSTPEADAAVPPDRVGVPFSKQLEQRRQRMLG